MKSIKTITSIILCATSSLSFAAPHAEPTFKKKTLGVVPSLYSNLGDTFTVPDGMALDSNNNVVLAVPNYIDYDTVGGAKIVTLDNNGHVIHSFNKLPLSKKTGKVHPMGLGFGPDGNLYIADNQFFSDENHASRILRLRYKDGKPTTCEVVVEGTTLSNAVRWQGNYLYLSDTVIKIEGKENQSGVYRFHLDELQGKPIKVDKKKHLLVTYTGETGFGADGLTFDKNGNMYCGLFGDGQVFKTTFNKDGSVIKTDRIINNPAFECCDGITCDLTTNKIYMTNSAMNSVWIYDIENNTMQRLWQNADDDGKSGLLDQPCEPIIRGNELLVVNFDMTFPGLMNRENDSVNSISKFKIK